MGFESPTSETGTIGGCVTTLTLHKIERLMRGEALRARPMGLPKDDGERSIAPVSNVLDHAFTAERPNQKWIADFTYIWTAEGWLYVAAVIDCSRAALSVCR